MKHIPKFLTEDKDLPTDFVTEDSCGGDATPQEVFNDDDWEWLLERIAQACVAFIVSGLFIGFGYWAWRLQHGQ